MKIISYNVNGIRAALKKGLGDWIKENDYDIICFQESKAQEDQIDIKLFNELGYQVYVHSASKKGYSGVVVLSKIEPESVDNGCGIEYIDFEGRVIQIHYKNFTLLNCYFPSGTTGDVRQAVKYKFLDDFYNWILDLKKKQPNLIVVGDYNIAHAEIDIHNPKSKNSGFLPEERAWMTKWFESGFVDAFRFKNPELQTYSWWTYRVKARANNKGWRIDYQSVSTPIKDKIIDAQQLNDVVHSDHCPVYMEIDLL